jgi:DNA-binding MarR family transcriptional regulator
MNALGLDWIASPATIHRRLTELQKTGYIFLKHEGENKRTKYVVTTLKAREYFNEVESCLLLSVS